MNQYEDKAHDLTLLILQRMLSDEKSNEFFQLGSDLKDLANRLCSEYESVYEIILTRLRNRPGSDKSLAQTSDEVIA